MSKYDNAGVRAFLRFAGEFSTDPRCVELKQFLQNKSQAKAATAEKLLSSCQTAVAAFNEQEFIVFDSDSPTKKGKSLGLTKEGQEKLAFHAQQVVLHALMQ